MTVPAVDVDIRELAAGVRAGDRAALGRAITLVESTRDDHRARSQALLELLLPHSGSSHRIGVTGAPGVGKSAFIETLGTRLTGRGHKVAVLAVDPTSVRTGGSILGDKTRMTELSHDPNAFVRPSPSAGTLGGVTRSTRQSIIVVEAAGFDVVFVETVGVGQSEALVHGMVDFFLVLMLAGAGDELQGMKKGVLELADMLAVNKADGDNIRAAEQAAVELERALNLLEPVNPDWIPPVMTCSGRFGQGIDELWEVVEEHRRLFTESGEQTRVRQSQQLAWMHSELEERLLADLSRHPGVAERQRQLESAVREGALTPSAAVDQLLAIYKR
jgi:LAO/AO transport system kinase